MIKIEQNVSKEQYYEIQKFFFYKKKHMTFYIAFITICGILAAYSDIAIRKEIPWFGMVLILLGVITVIATNIRLKKIAELMYEMDITEWIITVEPEKLSMMAKNMTVPMTLKASSLVSAYELNSVILVYFAREQFVTICKDQMSSEELKQVKGILYDILHNKFKLKRIKNG